MSNIYRIGVNVAMSGNSSQFLGVLARDLLGVHANVNSLQGGISRLKLALGGALAIGAGVTILTAMKGPLEEARKFEQQVAKFSTFGLGTVRTKEAAEFAKQMNIAGSTYVDNMKRMSEAQGVFRESGLSGDAALRGAKLAAPVLGKIDFANSTLDDESRAKMNTQAMSMLRFIEMRGGVNSPEQFNAIADAGFKAIRSSGGNINWEQLRQFMARGGVAAQGLSNEALFGRLEPIIGELKGSTAGFMLRTSFNRLNGIQSLGMAPVAHELIDAGIWDASKVSFGPGGSLRRFNNGNPFLKAQEFATDPVQFYEKNILPMYAKRGYTETQMKREDALIFGPNAGNMFSLIRRQMPAINHSVEAQRKAMGIDAAYGAAGGTLTGKIADLRAKEANLQERLGEAILPLAVKGLQILVPAISKLTAVIAQHPEAMSIIAKGMVVVAGALIGLGVVAVGVAAVGVILLGGAPAAIAAGIGAIGGAIAALVVINWGTVVQGIKDVGFALAHPIQAAVNTTTTGMVNPTAEQRKKNSVPWFSVGGEPYSIGMEDAFNRKPAVPPPAPAGRGSGAGNVYMDGNKVGKIVSGHQASNMDYRRALGRYDPGLGLPAAAGGYAR